MSWLVPSMTRRRVAVRINRPLTSEQQSRVDATLIDAERNKDAIIARGRQIKRLHENARASLREAFRLLKHERETQGVTLQELESRTGIRISAISRLENDPTSNPTVQTLQRIATALGKRSPSSSQTVKIRQHRTDFTANCDRCRADVRLAKPAQRPAAPALGRSPGSHRPGRDRNRCR